MTDKQLRIIDNETGEILSDNDAWSRHRRIVTMRNGIERTFIDLGGELYWFEKEKQYKEMGHPTFESYLADPDVDINRRAAFRLMGVYKTFILEQKVTPVSLFKAGYTKLDIVRPYVDEENIEEMIAMATALSRSDLRKALMEGKGQDAEPGIDQAEVLLEKWGVQHGQVWKLGKHQLICGDCSDPTILARALQVGDPGMILNDPPYGMALDTDYSKMPSTKAEGNKTYSPVKGDDRQFQYNNFSVDCSEEFWFGADYYRKSLPDGGSWLVWDKRVEEKFDAMIGSAFELIWSKNKHKREIIRCNNTLFSGDPEARNKLHPTVKPTKVISWLLSKYSTKGMVILDMYLGAGTTIISCDNLGRICTAIEIEPKYVAVTLQRYLDATGIVPELGGG